MVSQLYIYSNMLEILTKTLPNGIFVRHWQIEEPRAIVLAVHGMGTHSGRFTRMADGLARAGFASYCYDHPGHGHSPGKRGHFESYSDMLDALESVLDHVKNKHSDLPIFLFGHSMGGNIVANFVIRRKPELTGVVLSSPWFKLAFTPPFFKMMLAKVAVRLFPSLSQSSKLNVNYISHDEEVLKAYDEDPLIHSSITPRFFLETSKAGLYALEHANEFALPLYLYHGTEDCITSFDSSNLFSQKVPNCRFKAWEGCFHEVHHEWVYPELMKTIVAFMEERLPSEQKSEDDYPLQAAG